MTLVEAQQTNGVVHTQCHPYRVYAIPVRGQYSTQQIDNPAIIIIEKGRRDY